MSRSSTRAQAIRTVFLWAASVSTLFAAAPTVWVFDSLTRIGPTSSAGTQTQMTIYAARGEYQSFQIGVQAAGQSLSTVNVTASALNGPGGANIPVSNISLFLEQFVTISASQASNGSPNGSRCTECPLGAGTYPDGLIPFVDPDTGLPPSGTTSLTPIPFTLSAGQNQPIWVDVLVPQNAAPGAYTGTFTISSDQGQSQVSLTLNVWNFALPLPPSMNSAFLTWDEAHENATDKELMRNRLMPETTMNLNEATSLQSAFGLDSHGAPWFSGADNGNCVTLEGPPTVAQVQAATGPYQQLNMLVYDYSFDEVSACTNLYQTIIQWAQSLHPAGVDQLVTIAPVQALFDDGLGTGRSAVDIWAMEPGGYVRAQAQNPPLATAALAKGDKIWAYQALVQDSYSPKWLIDFAPIGIRAMAGFLGQALGSSGLLYWKVDGWLSGTGAGSWTNVFYNEGGSSYPGEGILVYPGEAIGMPGKVAPSMRLKQFRDGEQDYEYIQLLKNLGQSSQAAQIVATVASSYSNWSQTPATLQAARMTLGQMLNSLSQVQISATPSSLTFSATGSGPASPASENISISAANGTNTPFTVAVQSNGGSWLTLTSTQGNTTATVGVTASASGLAAGTYSGSVVITAAGASNSPLTIPVSLTVNPAITLSVSPIPLLVRAVTGSNAHANLAVAVSNGGSVAFNASASTVAGGNWLTVQATGTTPQSFAVAVDATILSPGVYTGSVTLDSPFGNVTVPVGLVVTPAQSGPVRGPN